MGVNSTGIYTINQSDAVLNSSIDNIGFRNSYDVHRIAAPELLIVDRIITPVWYVIGIIGNPLSIKIWLSEKVRRTNTSAIYLGYIAIVHTAFICLHIWMELLQAWGIQTINRPIMCQIFMTLYMVPQYLAPILILGFTCERFIAVCFPFKKEDYCTVNRAFVVVTSLTLVAVVFSLFQAYVWTYDDLSGVCEIKLSVRLFNEICTWITEMLCFAVTPLAVLILNIRVILEIRRINKFAPAIANDSDKSNSGQTSTFTLLSVSFYLICTLLPATIVYIIQLSIHQGNLATHPKDWTNDSSWTSYLTYFHIRKIIEEICFSNFACYFFIYYTTSPYFRLQVHSIFNCCLKRKYSLSNSVTGNGTNYEVVNYKTLRLLLNQRIYRT